MSLRIAKAFDMPAALKRRGWWNRREWMTSPTTARHFSPICLQRYERNCRRLCL